MIRSNQAADAAPEVLRIALDAKATVKIGPLARGGKSRVQGAAAEHDVAPAATVTPVGLFLSTEEELFVYGVTSHGTSDCLVDRLRQWWEAVRERFPHLTTRVLTLENGPEHHSRRTQCMPRMVDVVRQYPLHVRWAYSPPYHSKDNPVERCWGILEHHGNGALLDS